MQVNQIVFLVDASYGELYIGKLHEWHKLVHSQLGGRFGKDDIQFWIKTRETPTLGDAVGNPPDRKPSETIFKRMLWGHYPKGNDDFGTLGFDYDGNAVPNPEPLGQNDNAVLQIQLFDPFKPNHFELVYPSSTSADWVMLLNEDGDMIGSISPHWSHCNCKWIGSAPERANIELKPYFK